MVVVAEIAVHLVFLVLGHFDPGCLEKLSLVGGKLVCPNIYGLENKTSSTGDNIFRIHVVCYQHRLNL